VSLTPERWRLVNDLFHDLLASPPGKRSAILRRCDEDTTVIIEAKRMLDAHNTGGSALDQPIIPGTDAEAPLDATGLRIGDYRIIEILGSGGMGVVYTAEQESPRRTVAIKLLPAGLSSRSLLRRFEHEAEILGRLTHPGIAQVYEAGVAETPLGKQPYFAMELVEGKPLLDDCDERKPDLRGKLELMAKICDAVQHAHTRGVIHRDLKPANILINAAGNPKIIDFGIARIIDVGDTEVTAMTRTGDLIGTLQYMSPEQCRGDQDQIDTRSDVYSLGVVLYELLADRPVFNLDTSTPMGAFKTICEINPVKLGTVVRGCRGDIEIIVAKAMEKDPQRRYQSADALAEDIRRYLAGKPIAARATSRLYLLRRFAHRNKPLVLGLSGVTAAILVGLAATSWKAHQVRVERDFLLDVWKLVQVQGSTATPEIVDNIANIERVSDRVLEGTLPAGNLELAINEQLGSVFYAIGGYERAARHYDRTLDLTRETRGETSNHMLRIAEMYARSERAIGHTQRAQEMLVQTLAAVGIDDPYEVFAQLSEVSADEPEDLSFHIRRVKLVAQLAGICADEGRLNEARRLYPFCIRAMEQLEAANPPSQQWTLLELRPHLALVLSEFNLGQDEAMQLAQTAFDARVWEIRRQSEEQHNEKASYERGVIGEILVNMGRVQEAEAILTDVLDRTEHSTLPSQIDGLRVSAALGRAEMALGKHAQATQRLKEVVDKSRQYVPGNWRTHAYEYHYAAALEAAGRTKEARAEARRALQGFIDLGLAPDDLRRQRVADLLDRLDAG
jgi:eukaryotic-like serine/threonine-protein kinase